MKRNASAHERDPDFSRADEVLSLCHPDRPRTSAVSERRSQLGTTSGFSQNIGRQPVHGGFGRAKRINSTPLKSGGSTRSCANSVLGYCCRNHACPQSTLSHSLALLLQLLILVNPRPVRHCSPDM